jgi:hypothetical protein
MTPGLLGEQYSFSKLSTTCNTALPVVASSLKTWIASSHATILPLLDAPLA